MTVRLMPDETVGPAQFDQRNPATGALIGTYPVHSTADVQARVAQARDAQQWWQAQGFAGRRRRLTAWIRWIAQHSDEICELGYQETGKPRGDVQFELVAAMEDLRWAAAHAQRVLGERRVAPGLLLANYDARLSYQPLGVAGVIAPWNFPVYTVFCGMAYALAAGNGVVVKPSEFSTATGVWAVESFYRALPDAPAGLVSWVSGFGETGAALCRSGVDKLAFTGSVPTGRRVMQACAENLTPVLLELGGKDAVVVAEDADLDAAAHGVVFGANWHAGQGCVCIERVYVVEAVRDEFLRRVKQLAEGVRVGLEDDGIVDYGPMTLPAQVETVRRHVTDALAAGATALVGGLESIREPYIDPIILLEVPEDCSAVQEETFGPVVVINTVRDVQDAVARANGTKFGLGSAVYSRRRGKEIADQLRAGGTTVNGVLTFVGLPSLPFGGIGDSGFGRFHGDDGLREFCYAKSIARKRFPLGADVQRFPRVAGAYDDVRKLVKLRYARRLR